MLEKTLIGAIGALSLFALMAVASREAHATNPSILGVQGPQGVAVTATAPPVQVGGFDLAGKVRRLFLDPSGRMVAGNVDRVSYTVATSETVPTAAQALGAIEADGTNKIRLRYIKICPDATAVQTTAGERTLVLYPTTAASASGSTATPVPTDVGDAAFAGVARTGALTTTTAIGSVTAANALWQTSIFIPSVGTTAAPCAEKTFSTSDGFKPPTSGIAITSGLALGDLSGGTGGTGHYLITMSFTAEPN